MKPSLPQGIGFVYLLANPDFTSVKIGFTTRLVEARVEDLQTSAPKPFEIVYRRLTSRARQVEERAHELVADHRLRGEWFEVAAEAAKVAIDQAAAELEGITAWEGQSPVRLHFDARLEQQPTSFLSMREGDRLIVLRQQSWVSSSDMDDIWYAHSTGDQLELQAAQHEEDVFGMTEPDERTTIDTLPFLDERGMVHNLALNGREFLKPGDRLVWVSHSTTGRAHCVIFDIENYLQVTSRTVEPKFSVDGPGLIMNYPPDLDPPYSPEAARLMRAALEGHRPRTLPETTPFFP